MATSVARESRNSARGLRLITFKNMFIPSQNNCDHGVTEGFGLEETSPGAVGRDVFH